MRRLLAAALDHDPGLLPLLLIETFCGVRPEEAVRVLWTDLDLLHGRLTIRAAISKTGTARSIELAPCALVCARSVTMPVTAEPALAGHREACVTLFVPMISRTTARSTG
ncbi:MAG: hypothetical protein JOZ08_09845 [Verrucomicrobia bacterium]|nr:hypothetical protein [Verrucomicrobiota bacterium]